jgi:hypothetical protein
MSTVRKSPGVNLIRMPQQDRPEDVIPQRCADAVISSCKSIMASVVLEQWYRQFIGTVMIYEQIPGIASAPATKAPPAIK